MRTVKSITIYVGPKLERIEHPAPELPPDDGSLCQLFHKTLTKERKLFRVKLDVPPFPPVVCHFAQCGYTAGAAAWSVGENDEAVSAYLSGLDRDDERAVELALASRPYPISLFDWHKVLQMKKPILATFLLTPTSLDNRVIITAAPALANSLFSYLDVG